MVAQKSIEEKETEKRERVKEAVELREKLRENDKHVDDVE